MIPTLSLPRATLFYNNVDLIPCKKLCVSNFYCKNSWKRYSIELIVCQDQSVSFVSLANTIARRKIYQAHTYDKRQQRSTCSSHNMVCGRACMYACV